MKWKKRESRSREVEKNFIIDRYYRRPETDDEVESRGRIVMMVKLI